MIWVKVFSIYIFRVLTKIVKLNIIKELLNFPFNSVISTKTDSMFTVFSETFIDEGSTKEIKCLTFEGSKKQISNIPLNNDTTYTITNNTIKFLEISINVEGQYINYNNPAYIGTEVGECVYSLFINETIYFNVALSNYPFGGISSEKENVFVFGKNLSLYNSPEWLRKSFKFSLLYTNSDELQGLSLRIKRPIKNSLGHDIGWESENQTIVTVKYWDVVEGSFIETKFDTIYFENI